MEVHVINSKNQNLYQAELDQYFYERHKIYAEELNWVPEAPDRREYDAYDTDHATHFVGIENGRVIAGSRLVPTSEPHLLSDVFEHICVKDGGLVCRPDVAEWTRGFIAKEARGNGSKHILFLLCYAVMEYSMREGIYQLGGIQRTYWLQLWQRMGWNVYIKGPATYFGREAWVPAYFDVTQTALEGAKRSAGVDGSILKTRGQLKAFVNIDRAA